MSQKLTWYWKVLSASFSIPFEVFGYRISIGAWLRVTKDSMSVEKSSKQNGTESDYKHSPLRSGSREIRLLELHPGRYDDPLSGSERIVTLDSVTSQYDALSYVWGKPGDGGHTISIGAGNLILLPNLGAALRAFRSNTETRTIWADALCINQQDMHERNEQVGLMAEIYSNARSVLVWLGQPTSHSLLGMDVLSFLAGEVALDERAPWNRSPPGEIASALRDILERTYFQRVWVVQEAALGQRIQMRVGNITIHWANGHSMRRFLARIKLAEISPPWQGPLVDVDFRPLTELLEQSLGNTARRNGTIEKTTLLDLVHMMRHRHVTDVRDKLYGVMSLATPAEVARIVPDYSLSWEETYRRFYAVAEEQLLLNSCEALVDAQGNAAGGFGRVDA
ncbi:uncharacterized protein DNG_00865 [Cephalotrichum gorgonifer]|uniref:Heterokaryon incompatibility domain-containing protein n=1 Tax=Cephalotrichum gorgonifer TaxID=2041049 RepID=A0AAE8MR18_9PEZI|nr:uncharacterized protein DNG_00865 [Cephalotrichum gorgonifer]